MIPTLESKTYSPTSKYLPKYPCTSALPAISVFGVNPVFLLIPAKAVDTRTRSTDRWIALPNYGKG